MLSTDRTILEDGTSSQSRMRSYGTICESLFVVIAGVGKERRVQLSENVTAVYPGGGSKVINFFRILYLSRTLGADVISAQDPLWTGLIAVLSGKKAIQIQIHTDTWGWVGTILAPYVLRRATGVRVVSARIKEKAARLTKAPIAVLPIFIDVGTYATELPCPPEYGPHPRLLVVGRLAPEKRVHLTIEALTGIPEAHLYIVGDGPLRANLESRAKKLGVHDRVHFIGWRNDVSAYYQHANCFVLTSAFEGYGMVLVEAALAGCPIVSTHVGVAPELPSDIVTITTGVQYDLVKAMQYALTPDRNVAAHKAAEHLRSTRGDFASYLTAYQQLLQHCGT